MNQLGQPTAGLSLLRPLSRVIVRLWRVHVGLEHEVDGAGFASAEVNSFWRYIGSSLDRFMSMVDELTLEQLNWRPPAPDANSIYVLAIHTLANVRANVLQTLCGQPMERYRASEFLSVASKLNVPIPFWLSLRGELVTALSAVPSEAMDQVFEHPGRGAVSGREVLLIVARHTAEHLGHAELTRDLIVAARA